MDHQFKRLLNLVRRTGDRLVVTDPNGEDTYVLMGLEAYENLADRLPSVEPEPWDKPRRFDHDFIDDYYDEDYDDEEDEFKIKPEWEIPEELSSDPVDPVGANGGSPTVDRLPTEANITDKKIWDIMPPAGDKSETWNPEKFNEEEKKVVEDKFEKPEFTPKKEEPLDPSILQGRPEESKGDSAPFDSGSGSSETDRRARGVEASKNEDEPGEEQFYLEPVE